MPVSTSAESSRCRLDGVVPRNSANSERNHHFSGWVRVAARSPCRVFGKRASNVALLRIMRKLLRILRKDASLNSKDCYRTLSSCFWIIFSEPNAVADCGHDFWRRLDLFSSQPDGRDERCGDQQ